MHRSRGREQPPPQSIADPDPDPSAHIFFGWSSIYINRPFAELFQGEEALNEELLRGNSSPRAMILRIIHALDRAEVDRLLDYCFFISAEECCEAVHVLRVSARVLGSADDWVGALIACAHCIPR